MNFLLRGSQPAITESVGIPHATQDKQTVVKPGVTLEGLIAEETLVRPSSSEEDTGREGYSFGSVTNEVATGTYLGQDTVDTVKTHSDVAEEDGWITIPCNKLPEDWTEAPSIDSLRSLDRSFVFPGEQLQILVCLSVSQNDVDVITPFRVAAVMSKSGNVEQKSSESTSIGEIESDLSQGEAARTAEDLVHNDPVNDGDFLKEEQVNPESGVSSSESLLRMEDHKQQTKIILQKFMDSHFFVRIASASDPLWCKRSSAEPSGSIGLPIEKIMTDSTLWKSRDDDDSQAAAIEHGGFNPKESGGVARNIVKCCSLPSGDIVVALQINVGVDIPKDPVLEVLQFEKYEDTSIKETHQNRGGDPCSDLLKWLLPLDRPLTTNHHPLTPQPLSSTLTAGISSQKFSSSSASASPLFSFGNFRSYSMSSLPQSVTPPVTSVPSPSKGSFDLEDWENFLSQKHVKTQEVNNKELLSFRGVSLEPLRFSVRCGLEGLYIPGRRWRRNVQIVQPIEIKSFASDCNADNLLCVQIKNISPAQLPDIVIYIDAINIVFEDASKEKPPISLPIACIEAGNSHTLPNLSLRRGEEHSFIIKPALSMWKHTAGSSARSMAGSQQDVTTSVLPKSSLEKVTGRSYDQYSIIVSCRSNYTGWKICFKHLTSWRPQLMRDLLISVTSETSKRKLGLDSSLSQLPAQVLTLQTSNLTSEDLTLTVLAPASFSTPSSVVSLNSAPSTPMRSSNGFRDFQLREDSDETSPNKKNVRNDSRASIPRDDLSVDFVPDTGLSCTHLWSQSTVPLGCVPSQSTATVKLELLPLTDGIITLDTLQVAVKEKDVTYIPEHSLKIYSTSSIATGIA